MKSIYILLLVAIILPVAAWFLYKYNRDLEEKKPIELYRFPHYIPRRKKQEEEVRNGVPLVIYQSWKSHELPKGMRDNILRLLETNPEFDYYLYSDEECAAFIADNFDKDVLAAFHTLKPGAYKSDLWRYCILYKLGGVYLDIKYYSTVPLISIIDETSTVFVKDLGKYCVYNAFLISPPKNEIFRLCINNIVESCKNKLYRDNSLDITGPCLLGRILQGQNGSKYIASLPFTHGVSLFMDRYIWYKDKVILKEYDSYRLEHTQSRIGKHYSDMYRKRDVYN
jgi:mannosyltransferase OCH1-like enzyme